MVDPKRVRVTGPLAVYHDGFAEELVALGYRPDSAARQVQLMAHVSRWMQAEGLGAGELTPLRVEEFLDHRRAEGSRCSCSIGA